jgi:flagellin-like hook-associated protein FlgL
MFSTVPITLGANAAVGSVSSRVQGDVDLNPALTGTTRLLDLNGARGAGVTLGTIEMSINGGARISVDLAGADTAQDIDDKITSAIKAYETANATTVLAGAGITSGGSGFNIALSGASTINFYDPGTGVTAKDLGLTGITFNNTTSAASNINPRLTWQSAIGGLQGVTGALGQIKINNAGKSAVIDLSTATTLQELRNTIEGAGLGVRVEINDAGTGINVVNEVSAGRSGGLSIEEVSGQNYTATRLGIRSLTGTTAISDFNEGRGVRIVNGVTDPTSGTATYALNKDFTIALGDVAGTKISVDLRPQDMTSVSAIIARINAEAAPQLASAGLLATDFVAGLSDGGNGIVLTQNASFASAITVTKENNSNAAEDLGFLNGTYSGASASFVAQDRAKVRVDNLFTRLIDLRDALNTNDTKGITRAGEDLQSVINIIAQTRGEVGGYGKTVNFATTVEEDRNTVDTKVRSELQDVDFTDAATRYSMLQTQLNAGLQVTGRIQARTLLDFLTS